MTALLQDLRDALRALVRAPGLALAAVLSLALGIGANTAIFSVAHALLITPLPYADPERLVILWNRSPGLNITEDWFSTAQYFDIRNASQSFDDLAIAIGANANLTGDGRPERVGVIQISPNLLPMLGARPAIGRLFTSDDAQPGRPCVAILHDRVWTRRFARQPDVLDRAITLNGAACRVVGVLDDAFSLPQEVLPTLGVVDDGEVLRPLVLGPNAPTVRTAEDYNIVGKLKRGVAVADAQREMDALTATLRRDHPDVYPPNGGLTFSIVPLLDQVVGGVRTSVIVLAGSVGFVLLIACANVANLLLARAASRQREVAIRSALGATRARLARQLLTESVVLAIAGGAIGIALAMAGVRWMHVLQPQNVPRLGSIAVNTPVLLFTAGLSIASGILFGLAPVFGSRHINGPAQLRDAGRGMAASGALLGRGMGLRRLLVVAELALAVMLLIGAGLLVRSFAHVLRQPAGFDATGVLTFELSLAGPRYPDAPAVRQGYLDLWERLDHLPGVIATGSVTTLPLTARMAWGPMTAEGVAPPAGENFFNADMRTAGGRYFEAMGISLLRGRLFGPEDVAGGQRVVIVDDVMADELWPGQDPIGRRVKFGDASSTSPWETVIGVVGRVKHYGLDTGGRMALYRPSTQSGARTMFVTVRASVEPESLVSAVTSAVYAVDPDVPISNMRTMPGRVAASLAQRRFAMTLLSLFAVVALALAAIGVYGVLAFLVSQGTREVGIRIALGATPRTILGMVVGRGLGVTSAGVLIGLAGALALTRFMQSLLFGVPAADLATFGGVALVAAVIAIAASVIPARRASAVDPMVSLRSE